MPITINVYTSLDYTAFTAVGALTFEEIRNALECYYEDSPSRRTSSTLWDLRRATLKNLLDEEIKLIINFVNEYADLRRGAKAAILAPDDLDFALLKQHEALMRTLTVTVRPFRSKDEAVEWLTQSHAETQ